MPLRASGICSVWLEICNSVKNSNMNTKAAFPLSLDFEGRHYAGTVTPSGDTDKNGTPVYYRVTLGDKFFAYLCCADNGWMERDGIIQPPALINAVGDYIRSHYA
jgi:hypothetical protein